VLTPTNKNSHTPRNIVTLKTNGNPKLCDFNIFIIIGGTPRDTELFSVAFFEGFFFL
jgi:hypothetical protein